MSASSSITSNNNDNNDNNNQLLQFLSSSSSTTSAFITSSLNLIFSSVPITLLFILIAASLLYMFAVIYRNLRFIFVHWIRQPHDLRKRYGAGSWVCITGSSNGIGLGFAVEFAKLGFNIVLMSRSDENLQKAKSEVIEAGKDYGVQVRTVVIDFSEGSTLEFWRERFLKPIEDLDISVLVNNVGMNHTDNFENINEKILLDFISVNCTSQMMATRMLIKKLIARTTTKTSSSSNSSSLRNDENIQEEEEEQKRSAIISISSVAGQRPLLYLAPYSGTKSFNDVFSRALSLEYASSPSSTSTASSTNNNNNNNENNNINNSVSFFSDLTSYLPGSLSQSSSRIDVLSCRPGYVVSNMSQLTEAGGFVLDKYECAKGCMEKLGFVSETYGDVRHAIYCLTYQFIPEFWLRRIRQKRLEAKKAKVAEKYKNSSN